MSRSMPPNEGADRLAIRELIDAYAHCADRRDKLMVDWTETLPPFCCANRSSTLDISCCPTANQIG